MFLYILFKEQVQDIALLMSLLELDIVLFCKLSCLFQCLYFTCSSVSTSFQSTPAYFFTASTIVIRSNGLPRSISTPL